MTHSVHWQTAAPDALETSLTAGYPFKWIGKNVSGVTALGGWFSNLQYQDPKRVNSGEYPLYDCGIFESRFGCTVVAPHHR